MTMVTEETCGQEMAAGAEVPRQWQALMSHVAANMDWHAAWVGEGSPAAKREHDALIEIAGAYRAMADAAARAVAAMTAMKDLDAAPHDPARFDRPGQARWMRTKIEMQRDLARLLVRHADESEAVLVGPLRDAT
jgi:hypothetical protein